MTCVECPLIKHLILPTLRLSEFINKPAKEIGVAHSSVMNSCVHLHFESFGNDIFCYKAEI